MGLAKGTIGALRAGAKALKTKEQRAKNELVKYAKEHGHDARLTNKGLKVSDEPMDVYKHFGTEPKYKNLGKKATMGRLRRHLGY
jgi:hypothetical protein|tara:strand:- start:2804 stop:3058 length:255 start_codon:yes stop_codon:yes gene_type:complete